MLTLSLYVLFICALLTTNFLILYLMFFVRKKRTTSNLINVEEENSNFAVDNSLKHHKDMMEKLDCLLKEEKLYMKSDLSLGEIAEKLGTNRTYVSVGINSFYKQNFSSYLNTYRWDELQNTLQEDDLISNKELASVCGFGSIDSMKRIVKQKTGLSFKEWKSKICQEDIA